MLVCWGRAKLGLQKTWQARHGKIGSLLLLLSGLLANGCQAAVQGQQAARLSEI